MKKSYQEKANERQNNRYKQRKANNLCVDCGKFEPKKDRVRCEICLQRLSLNRNAFTKKGICYLCRKNPVLPSLTICEKCSSSRKQTASSLKQFTVNKYGGKCACCGESRLEFLCVDHINNDGKQHRKTFRWSGCGRDIYKWLRDNNYPEGFQVLCFNCNHSKGLFGECAHNPTFSFIKSEVNSNRLGNNTKVCIQCGLEKNIQDFHVHSNRNGKTYSHCKVCHNNRVRVSSRKLKVECLENYGGAICQCCGETKIEFLTIDHINRDGTPHRKEISKDGKGAHIYRWLKKNNFPSGFRVLCMNCNFSIGHFGYCPHQQIMTGG
jgi:hypothetical protein